MQGRSIGCGKNERLPGEALPPNKLFHELQWILEMLDQLAGHYDIRPVLERCQDLTGIANVAAPDVGVQPGSKSFSRDQRGAINAMHADGLSADFLMQPSPAASF